jgi:hypothetical protein
VFVRAGRAERLGLAISLVSAVPERVWYCTKKGYKPWLKPSKGDVKLNDQKGHTIWYNEQQLLKVSIPAVVCRVLLYLHGNQLVQHSLFDLSCII